MTAANEVFPAHIVDRVLAVLGLGLEDRHCDMKGVDQWYGRINVALVTRVWNRSS